MYFEDSKFFNTVYCYKYETYFGDFYFSEKFIIAELKHGIHYNWDMIEILMDEVIKFYGKDVKLKYIANRVNSFSVDPNVWSKLDKIYNLITNIAIVSYNRRATINAMIEKHLFGKNMTSFETLEEAINWTSNLENIAS
ncbi:hypothetical protein MHTCC0001_30140 [Flavobacteriaceae bacterium MHTCC 0001]